MTKAEMIVETLLARTSSRPLSEGLEGELTRYLETLGYQNGPDFYFENGLKINNPGLVDDIIGAINQSGHFGAATAQDGQVSFEPWSPDPSSSDQDFDAERGDGTLTNADLDARYAQANPAPSPEPDTSVMCDNCGAHSHHTEECPYSFGANPQ